MSRILPLEKDVNLDKRFINETNTITESALESLISGGGSGGGSDVIMISNLTWPTTSKDGVEFATKAEACAACGLTEEQWAAFISGEAWSDIVFSMEANGQRMSIKATFLCNSKTESYSYRKFALWSVFLDEHLEKRIGIAEFYEQLYDDDDQPAGWADPVYEITGIMPGNPIEG